MNVEENESRQFVTDYVDELWNAELKKPRTVYNM